MEKKRASNAAVVIYGLGDLASQFVWTFVGSYLTVFYTDIVGLAPLAISVIMLAARIWDAFNDPMMGSIAERSRFKMGRFRPWIAFGCPFLAIFGVLTFTAPFSGRSAAGVFWAAFTYIVAGMIYTLVNIPYGALAGVMTEDAEQRNKINSCRSIGMNLGIIIVNGLSATLMLKFSRAGAEVADSRGYMMTAVLYGIISIPMFIIVALACKEVVKPKGEPPKFSLKDTISNLVRNKYLMLLLVIMILIMTAFMGRLAVAAFYAIYCMNSFQMIAVIMTIPSIATIVGSFFAPMLIKKMGKRNLLFVSCLLMAGGLLIIYFSPFDNYTMIIVGSIVYGLVSLGFPISLSMLADAVDYMEDKTGVRTDGTAYATYGLATKIGNAIGGSVGVLIMAAFGYVANQPQTEQALKGINITVNLLPAIVIILAAVCTLFWRMSDKDADEIRERLHKKHNAQ